MKATKTKTTTKPLPTRKQLESMARAIKVKREKEKSHPTVQVTGEALEEIHYSIESIKVAVQSGLEHDKNQATALAWLAIGVVVNLVVQSYYLYELVSKH
jgi:hypothetical protein